MARGRGTPLLGALAGAGLAAAVFSLLTLGERRRPLRRRVEAPARRRRRNLALGALTAAVVQVADRPFTTRAAALAERQHLGLLARTGLPPWARQALAFLLLDYTLWLWHVLLHRWPPLWRLHAVHHADAFLDTSTAVRFHPGEFLASVPWRAAQVVLIGAGPGTLRVWQAAVFLSVLFHHSNLRLPDALERLLSAVFVTPRQHGIHHSVVPDEADSNWSSLFNVWDRLHGTLRLDVPQETIVIGLPGAHGDLPTSVPRLLSMPFEEAP